MFVNFVVNIFAVRANSKFQFVGAAVRKIHSQAAVTTTRSQAVARIADRTAKNCRDHVT